MAWQSKYLADRDPNLDKSMALIIAGERSGVGKTTVTLALLAALKQRRISVQSFKVGPDYIDPMFHQHVTGRPCRTLDPVLTSETYVKQCFEQHGQRAEAVVIEGVMGLFDGAAGAEDYASTAHIARLLQVPILLVLDCSRLSHSIAALVHGYRSFDPRLQIAGVVLNRVGSDRHLELLQTALVPLNLPILGTLRRQDQITIPDRHLGLVPTGELTGLDHLLDRLAHLGQTNFDWPRLFPLLPPSPPPPSFPPSSPPSFPPTPIAIAQDAAFNFYYPDNLELLTALGADLIPWSPLCDASLPRGVQGLYLGGGFPEVFAAELAANAAVRQAVQQAIRVKMPVYAECGGLMYLTKALTDLTGHTYPMVGALPTTAVMGPTLTLGYRRATAQAASCLLQPGNLVYGHEFHRSHLTLNPESPLFAVDHPFSHRCPITFEGWHSSHLHASYLHLHWGATPELPHHFVGNCYKWKELTS